jgi:hypothetical protein
MSRRGGGRPEGDFACRRLAALASAGRRKDRRQRQWDDLTDEAGRAIELAKERPYLSAVMAFARKVETLRWSDSMVSTYEHTRAREMEWEAEGVSSPVCADMGAWVASGYTRLSEATKALTIEREAADRPFRRLLRRVFEVPGAVFSNPLAQYEGPSTKALAQLVGSVETQGEGARMSVWTASRRSDYALGVSSEAELQELVKESRELGMKPKLPPSRARVIGKGKTAADGSYLIWVEGRRRRGGGGRLFEASPTSMHRGCQAWIGILEAERLGGSLETQLEPREACLSRSRPLAPRVSCDGESRIVEAQTLAGARLVRLALRDGRGVLSRVVVVPRKLGGPLGFYYQTQHVWDAAPVSLTELDGHRKVLRTVVLTDAPRCATQWPFIPPGSMRTIVSGRVPGGPRFSIIGRHERLVGVFSTGSGASLRVEVGAESATEGIEPAPGGPFAWQVKTGCQPHEYAILYGTLKDARDTVWARGPDGLRQLRRARIPASLHIHGLLTYTAGSSVPSELVVRAPDGKAVLARKLRGIAREARETCEGEAEP